MGYTHFYETKEHFDAKKFKAFSKDVQKLVVEAIINEGISIVSGMGEAGTKPLISPSIIFLNGEEDNAHETLLIEQKQEGREFCKTARKPYDVVVASVLIALKKHFPENVKISSNGSDEEWKNAKEFCQKTLGYGKNYTMGEILYKK